VLPKLEAKTSIHLSNKFRPFWTNVDECPYVVFELG